MDNDTFLEVVYPMSQFDRDDEIRQGLLDLLRPHGVLSSDGAGSDGYERDISYTLPQGLPVDVILAEAQTFIHEFDGRAKLLRPVSDAS